ncbi:class I SAM-dependent methyltransferase [candidate division WOR-3 bacterium]|nr:class I SAM-dependent methyltransferase [candidate division WOR-3 bacterium]
MNAMEHLGIHEPIKMMYGMVTTERIVEHPFVFQNLSIPKGSKILDVGCSYSLLSIQLASLGYKVTGYDLDEHPLNHPNLEFIKGNFLDNTFDDNTFDAVISVSTIEHCGLSIHGSPSFLRGDYKVINEVARVLKEKARFIMSVPFGKEGFNPGYRVYNPHSLGKLLGNFTIKKAEYFVGINRMFWTPVALEEISEVDCISKGFTQGVACVVAEVSEKLL